MTDIVRVADEYYVRASSALVDDRTRVLKCGDTFAVLNRYGDIEDLGFSQFGLFHAESRHLSRFSLRLNQQQLELVDRTIRAGVAPDRAALIRLALRETAAARRRRPGAKAPA